MAGVAKDQILGLITISNSFPITIIYVWLHFSSAIQNLPYKLSFAMDI